MKIQNRPRLNWRVQPRLSERFTLAVNGGGWWCSDCELVTEYEESDQGQPASCGRCGSHRIEYHPPITG